MDVYWPLYERRSQEARRQRVGFVGRVVPIKDVKTLVKACGIVNRELPDTEFWIVGPTDEDELYFQECEQLATSLGISGLKFTGPQDVKKIYPEIDLMILTSISEGQPLTLLECACAGVPAVASDVGSCRELLEGGTAEDKALGPSGIVTAVGAPEETAAAIIKLLKNRSLWEQMSQSGRKRIETYYQQRSVIAAYRGLYNKYFYPAHQQQGQHGHPGPGQAGPY
jgi:glycosyltransferase involved in cell wall biosynthesis